MDISPTSSSLLRKHSPKSLLEIISSFIDVIHDVGGMQERERRQTFISRGHGVGISVTPLQQRLSKRLN